MQNKLTFQWDDASKEVRCWRCLAITFHKKCHSFSQPPLFLWGPSRGRSLRIRNISQSKATWGRYRHVAPHQDGPCTFGDVVTSSDPWAINGLHSCVCSQQLLPRLCSWDILDTWSNECSWDLLIRRSVDTHGFTNFTTAHFVTNRHNMNSSQIPISSTCTCDIIIGFLAVINRD